MSSPTRKAFTLIELLVVIAIIAILSAIIFPVFATAREKARSATCQSNLKQLGIIFGEYEQDFDERLPMSYSYSAVSGIKVGWDVEIGPYLGFASANNPKPVIMQCPDDTLARSAWIGQPRTYLMPQSNSGFIGDPYTGTTGGGYYFGGIAISQAPEPAGTFLLVEGPLAGSTFGNAGSVLCSGPGSGNPTAQQFGMPPLHSNGYNYLYCDGHVKWLLPGTTVGAGTIASPKGPWTIAAGD